MYRLLLLCERTFRSRVNPAGRGSGGALGETPNSLSASPSLANGGRECQHFVANRRFKFQKRRQLFIGTHDETLSVAMYVHNPDHSPLRINGRDPAQAPSRFLEIVSDDFPVLHGGGFY